jgi:hypothetical protein
MLTANDYTAIKGRLLLVAEVSELVARAPDAVRFDEEQYPVVLEALVNAKTDVRKLLAETDVLRHMFSQHLFPAPRIINADTVPPDDAGTLEPMPHAPNETGRGEVPSDDAGISGEVQAGGHDGGRGARPKPRRNSRRSRKDSLALGSDDSATQVGGAEG